MKKLLILLISIFSLFNFTDVKAEEISTADQNVLNYLKENYDLNSSNFTILKNSSRYTSIIVDNINSYFFSDNYLYVGIEGTYLPFKYSILYFDLDGNFTSFNKQNAEVNTVTQYINSMSSLGSFLYSNVDIYVDQYKTDIKFEKNYIKNDDLEPEPTDTPEVDTSELEKCESFICDISDTILDGFNDERFPFVKITIKFLLLLLVIFVIISPFWLLYKFARWLM